MAKRTIQFSQFLIVFFPAFFLAQSVDKNLWKAQINLEKKYQTIDNFAAAGCWFAEGIGKYWPEEKKQKIAQLLFSRQTDDKGNPLGIGLSGWRLISVQEHRSRQIKAVSAISAKGWNAFRILTEATAGTGRKDTSGF